MFKSRTQKQDATNVQKLWFDGLQFSTSRVEVILFKHGTRSILRKLPLSEDGGVWRS